MIVLYGMLFMLIFAMSQAIILRIFKISPVEEAKKKMNQFKDSKGIREFVAHKQLTLKKMGADIFLQDGLTVSKWYLYKVVFGMSGFMIAMFITRGLVKSDVWWLISMVAGIIGFTILDLFIRLENNQSNEAMMSDITEMSRSVLYGKRGGQYIADALRDSVMVVENKRLKTALIRLKNNLDGGKSIDESLEEMEMSFNNGEISAFCTVIRSLQSTGQVDEALKTLENNIEREQIGVNKRRCVVLENKTMFYVMLIAFDILAVILYCIVMKLLEMQIAF